MVTWLLWFCPKLVTRADNLSAVGESILALNQRLNIITAYIMIFSIIVLASEPFSNTFKGGVPLS